MRTAIFLLQLPQQTSSFSNPWLQLANSGSPAPHNTEEITKLPRSQVTLKGLIQGVSSGQHLLQKYSFHFIMGILKLHSMKNYKIRKSCLIKQVKILPLSCGRNHCIMEGSGVHQRCSARICQALCCSSPSVNCIFFFLENKKTAISLISTQAMYSFLFQNITAKFLHKEDFL